MGRIVLFTAGPQGKGGGGWRMLVMEVWGGVCYASGSTAPAVVCHTEHRDSSLSLFQLFLTTHCLTLPFFLFLLLSACLSEPFE